MKGNRKYYTRDICAMFDISKATLFRWESEGLISGINRDWRNWRIYNNDNIEKIKRIIKSKGSR